MDANAKRLALAGVSIVASIMLLLAAFNVNNPFASKDPRSPNKNSPSFLHRFVALQLVYFSVIIAIREGLAIDFATPVHFLDRTTLHIISFLSSQFRFSVFTIVVGVLALDFDGGVLPGVVLVVKGLYLLYPTLTGEYFSDQDNEVSELDEMRRQTVERFVGTEYSTPQPRLLRPDVEYEN